MEPIIYYYREHRIWYGYWAEPDCTQILECVNSPTRDGVLIELGATRRQAEIQLKLNKLDDIGSFERECLMTISEFKGCVESGALIDFDGFGNWATEEKFESGFDVKPSTFKNSGFSHPDWATHVVWFNK